MEIFGILAFVFVVLLIGFLPSAIIEIIRAARGKVCNYMGEMDRSHLIIKTFQTAENTLVIPLNKIVKIELGKRQRRKHGEVVITIEGRTRHVTLVNVMEPRQMIEAFGKISNYNKDTNCIKIF